MMGTRIQVGLKKKRRNLCPKLATLQNPAIFPLLDVFLVNLWAIVNVDDIS